MKKIFSIGVFTVLFSLLGTSQTHVKGYYKSNGTYVAPHTRSSSNSTYKDNYSTSGNTNPYTGSQGTKSVPYNGNQNLQTGPRGGTYYINSNGNKTYVPKKYATEAFFCHIV